MFIKPKYKKGQTVKSNFENRRKTQKRFRTMGKKGGASFASPLCKVKRYAKHNGNLNNRKQEVERGNLLFQKRKKERGFLPPDFARPKEMKIQIRNLFSSQLCAKK